MRLAWPWPTLDLHYPCVQAKGHVADEIHIQVPSLAHQPRVPQVIGPHAVLQLGLSNQEAGALASEEEASKLAKGLDGKLVEPKEIPGSKFKHMAAKWVTLQDPCRRMLRVACVRGTRGTTTSTCMILNLLVVARVPVQPRTALSACPGML